MRGDTLRLPFIEACFDAVFTVSAWHYLDDPFRAVREAARVLAPGGRLVVTDWRGDFRTMAFYRTWLRQWQAPGRILHAGELIALIETVGLRLRSLNRFRAWPLWGLMTLRADKPTAVSAPRHAFC